MSHNTICLNCAHPTTGKFCNECGQKTDTHRITFRHFIMHDILHGMWHFEKGILYTLKEALFRPGQAALDYISGKRIRYYNVFYLILLLVGLGIFIESLNSAAHLKYVSYVEPEIEPESDTKVLDFVSKYAKFILFLALPIFSFNSYILFNKKKLNYSEHVIIFGILFLGIIVISLTESIMNFAVFVKPLAFLSEVSYYFVPIATFTYLTYGFYGAFGKDYSLAKFSLRLFLFIVMIFVYLKLLGTIIKVLFIN